MKNIIYVVLALLVFASCEKPNKIGFVDNGALINDFQEKKDVEAEFQIKQEAFGKRADSISQAFQAEAQKGQAKAQRLARTNRKKAEELMLSLQQKQQQLQQQMQAEDNQLKQAFQAEIDSVYGKEQSDLTQTILDALNADYKKE